MKKRGRQSKKFGIQKTRMKREAKAKKPEPVKPYLYTRRLKTKKQKKLKNIDLPLSIRPGDEKFNQPPADCGQMPSSSFREMMWLKNNMYRKHMYRLDTNVGDIRGMKRKSIDNQVPKGKRETEELFALRMSREAQDELLKAKIAKRADAQIVDPETFKSRKAKKSIKRLNEKRRAKKEIKREKRRTGFEHLRDKVKFGEVVLAPPTFASKPKKVGGHKELQTQSLDQRIQT